MIFCGQRSLSFLGTSKKIGDHDNGNFLGIIEVLSHWDLLLKSHVDKVKMAQDIGERLQAHYLSPDSQNEFISECSSMIRDQILLERSEAKYYSIIVDATPDSSHKEQETIILRYVHLKNNKF